ncbi:MAG: hypothetical protein WCA46_06705 [Actinocatenispora sp.]
MGISRRALGVMTGTAALGLVTGCSGKHPTEPEGQAAGRLEWLSGLDGVEKAETTAHPVDPREKLILLTLGKGIDDRAVLGLVHTVKKGFAGHDGAGVDVVELDVDGFHGQFEPSPSTKDDPDVDRALWLRRDGRATASVYGPSGLRVTAPQTAVVEVALGFDRTGGHEEYGRTHRVESTDRAVVVEWEDHPGQGQRLDRDVLQDIADLQKKYPHLTGWFDGSDHRAGVYFSLDDIGFDALLTRISAEVGSMPVELELGWGPARATRESFAKAFTGKVRTVLDRLVVIPGVAEFRKNDGTGPSGRYTITARNGAGYLAAVSTLRELWDEYVSVQLVREPSPEVGEQGRPVIQGSNQLTEDQEPVYTAVADLTGVTQVHVGANAAYLTVVSDISDPQLATALTAMATLPASFAMDINTNDDPSEPLAPIGTVTDRKFTAAAPGANRADPDLISRAKAAWSKAARS